MHTLYLRTSVLVFAIAGLCGPALAGTSAGSTTSVRAELAHHATALPAALRPAFYQALAKDSASAYRVNASGCATLPKSALRACFDNHGVHFTGAAMPLSLHLVAFGRSPAGHTDEATLAPVNPVPPKIAANRVSYLHGALTEWWRVLPMGFEQGFTVAKRPAGQGRLTLALAVSQQDAGVPSIRHSRESVNPVETIPFPPSERRGPFPFPPSERRGTEGDVLTELRVPLRGPEMTKKVNALAWGQLRYGKLVVTDAKGKVIPATLTSKGNRILIAVNDAQATYPLTVDPLVWIEQKVTASDGKTQDQFGFSVALDGSAAVIGANAASGFGNDGQGFAYVFSESNGTWSQTAKLSSSGGTVDDGFGGSVAVSGTTVLVGAPADCNNVEEQGAVYVFTKSGGTWSQIQKLSASDGTSGDQFGYSVALDGTTALIGANCISVNGNPFQGAAYVFSNSNGTWNQEAKLTASDGEGFDIFGQSVALVGNTALIGADQASGDALYQGAAYVFTRSGGAWNQTAKLTASDGASFDQFGYSVALSGNASLIGADGATINDARSQGAAYVFSKSNGIWTQMQKLTASDGARDDHFGYSVALAGDSAIIGEMAIANLNDSEGAAYVFGKSDGTWTQTQKLVASDGVPGVNFGYSVALFNATALVGAYSSNVDGTPDQGAAYFYGESDLGLAVSVPETVRQGQNYVSQGIATNNTSAVSPAVAVTMAVPAAASFISATASKGSCSEDSNIVTCNFGAIDGNAGTATANVTLKATGEVGDTIKNVAGIAKATPPLTASAATEIKAPNQPPVAKDGTLTTDENMPANGTLEATDPDGDPLTFIIVDQPKHGTVSQEVQGSNAYLYTPDKDYSGSDSFTFKANDGQADSNVATISITVKAAPPPPPPPGGGGGGGAAAPFGLGALAFIGLLAFLRRRR